MSAHSPIKTPTPPPVPRQLSEYHGLLMSSSFCDVNREGETAYGPGDKILKLHARPPLGPCSPTVHFMGYWHDKTKFGPLIYLLNTNLVKAEPETPKKSLRAFETQMQCVKEGDVFKSPNRVRQRGGFLLSAKFDAVSSDTDSSSPQDSLTLRWAFSDRIRALDEGLSPKDAQSKVLGATDDAAQHPPSMCDDASMATLTETTLTDDSVSEPTSDASGSCTPIEIEEESCTPERSERLNPVLRGIEGHQLPADMAERVAKMAKLLPDEESMSVLTSKLKIHDEVRSSLSPALLNLVRESSPSVRRSLSPSLLKIHDGLLREREPSPSLRRCLSPSLLQLNRKLTEVIPKPKSRFDDFEPNTQRDHDSVEDAYSSSSLTSSFKKGLSDSFKKSAEAAW